jgi:hypothetical protein
MISSMPLDLAPLAGLKATAQQSNMVRNLRRDRQYGVLV